LSDDHLMVEFRLEPGQMVFLSNHRVLHDRGRWVDDPDPKRKRHLERMWIRVR
jgi:alpha-ketoglutarate-dependent taurine dioxygenase